MHLNIFWYNTLIFFVVYVLFHIVYKTMAGPLRNIFALSYFEHLRLVKFIVFS